MKDIITRIKNHLYVNEPEEKDDIEALISSIDLDKRTMQKLEKCCKDTKINEKQMAHLAIKTFVNVWDEWNYE